MLAHPRSHSLTLSLASVFGLHVGWTYFSQARLPSSHSDGRCSSSLLSSLPVKSGHLHRSFLFLPLAIVSSLRLLQWSPADAPGRKGVLAGPRHCFMGRSCARNCSPSRVHLYALRRDLHCKGLSSGVTPKGFWLSYSLWP